MGDPRRIKKKYDKPRHPWRADRIEAEKGIMMKYGLANKREIWRAETLLRGIRRQARRLRVQGTKQAEREEKQLIDRLRNLNLVKENATLEDLLVLNLDDLLGRRLQTMVFKKGFSSTVKQARQFVVHGHVTVNGSKVTAPSCLIKGSEEDTIQFLGKPPTIATAKPTKVKEETG